MCVDSVVVGREKTRLAYVVLLTQFLAERGAHDVAADARRGTEVRLSRLASRAGDAYIITVGQYKIIGLPLCTLTVRQFKRGEE
jgi:hypothetical protein